MQEEKLQRQTKRDVIQLHRKTRRFYLKFLVTMSDMLELEGESMIWSLRRRFEKREGKRRKINFLFYRFFFFESKQILTGNGIFKI